MFFLALSNNLSKESVEKVIYGAYLYLYKK